MNGLVEVYRMIIAATAKHKGFQLVLSIGDQLDPDQIGPLPSNTILIARTDGRSKAADLLERSFGLTIEAGPPLGRMR